MEGIIVKSLNLPLRKPGLKKLDEVPGRSEQHSPVKPPGLLVFYFHNLFSSSCPSFPLEKTIPNLLTI